MTAYTDHGDSELLDVISAEVDNTTTVTMEGFTRAMAHNFLGVQMFDTNGDLMVDADAGSFAVTFKTYNTQQWEAPPDASIDSEAPTTLAWNGNVVAVKVVPTTLHATVVTWKVVLTKSRS